MNLNTQLMIVGIIVMNVLGFLLFNSSDLYNEFGLSIMLFGHLILTCIGSLYYFIGNDKEDVK